MYLGVMNDSLECEMMAMFQCTLAILSLITFKRVTVVEGFVTFAAEVGDAASKLQHFVDGPIGWLRSAAAA